LNLIDNAIKFTTVGTVRVAVEDHEEHVQIDVQDTGIGIPARQIERIFQPFHQLDDERGGSGLGLTSARQLVWRLGGEISVSSTEGVGTTFTVRLPRDLPHPRVQVFYSLQDCSCWCWEQRSSSAARHGLR